MTNIAENAGFIVLKDAKVVVFYTNDLKATPTAPTLPMENEEAIHAVNGTCIIRRWTGSEVMHRSSIEVPAIVGASTPCRQSHGPVSPPLLPSC